MFYNADHITAVIDVEVVAIATVMFRTKLEIYAR